MGFFDVGLAKVLKLIPWTYKTAASIVSSNQHTTHYHLTYTMTERGPVKHRRTLKETTPIKKPMKMRKHNGKRNTLHKFNTCRPAIICKAAPYMPRKNKSVSQLLQYTSFRSTLGRKTRQITNFGRHVCSLRFFVVVFPMSEPTKHLDCLTVAGHGYLLWGRCYFNLKTTSSFPHLLYSYCYSMDTSTACPMSTCLRVGKKISKPNALSEHNGKERQVREK